jgi:hypothetical protein
VLGDLLANHIDLYGHFNDNESFRKWLAETVFNQTYEAGRQGAEGRHGTP